MRMTPCLPIAETVLMPMPPIEVAVTNAGAVADDRAMLVMIVMEPGGIAVVALVAPMMSVSMPMVPLGERGGGRRDEQSCRA